MIIFETEIETKKISKIFTNQKLLEISTVDMFFVLNKYWVECTITHIIRGQFDKSVFF